MKHLLPLLTLFFCGATGAWAQGDPRADVAIPNEPILSGHSHNDYLRRTPLWDALSLGFISIEVDIHLVEGALLVGHDEEDLDATRTLQSLYLDPLRDHVRAHNGWVYPSEHSLDLLIDIKSDARSTYEALRGVLAQYSDMLTTYSETRVQTKAISVIVSGNRPRRLMMAEDVRLATYDGRIEDLGSRVPHNFISLISDDWEDHFSWRGLGNLSDQDSRRLAQRLEAAHRSGYRLRFWNIPAPDHRPIEEVWSQLLDAGVDLLSVDDVNAYRDFLVKRGRNDSPERLHGALTTIRIGDEAFSAGALLACHQRRQLLEGQRLSRLVRDHPSPAQHYEAVPNGVSVVRRMRDEHHGDAAVGRCAYVLQNTLGLPHAERRGGLVKDQDAGAEVERPGDRDGLALAA